MKNRILSLVAVAIMLFAGVFTANSQNVIKERVKRALNEKMFMKLSKEKDRTRKDFDTDKIRERDLKLDIQVADDEEGSEAEIFAAINPKDSNNIVVSAINFRGGFVKPMSISTYYTYDFGTTWQKSEFDGLPTPTTSMFGGGDPVLVYDKEGNLHLTYITLELNASFMFNEYFYHAVSKDGGKTWTTSPFFKSTGFDAQLNGIEEFLDKQWMVCDNSDGEFGGNIYLGLVNLNIKDSVSNIQINVTHASDSVYVYEPVNVTPDSFFFVQFTSVDIDESGNLYVGYIGSPDSLKYYFYNSVSQDGGKTFSDPRKISEVYYTGFTKGSKKDYIVGISKQRYFPSPYIVIDKSEDGNPNRIYATWTAPGIEKFEETGYDIYLSYSDDLGVNWSEPMIVNNDSKAGADQFYSCINVSPKGIPILTFYDKRANSDSTNHLTNYYVTYSTNLEDIDFSLQYPITSEPTDFAKIQKPINQDFGIGEYNKMVTTEHFAIPFWGDNRDNDGDINIYMALVPLDGVDYSVGLNEINLVSDNISVGKIYPNPSSGVFNIDIDLKKATDVKIEVFDVLGKMIYQRDKSKYSQGKHSVKINVENHKTENCFVLIKTNYGNIVRKVVLK